MASQSRSSLGAVGRGVGRTLFVVAVIVATVAGCSSPGERTVIAASSEAAVEAPTARVRLETIAGFEDEPEEPTIAEGVVDFATGAGRLTSSTELVDGTTSILIATDGAMFIGLEADPIEWYRRPPIPGNAQGPDTPTDPVAIVSTLRSSAASIEDAGVGTVRGSATTRQTLSLPDGLPAGVPFRSFMPSYRGVATIDVDGEGRLRRLLWHQEIESASASADGSIDIRLEPVYVSWTMEFWDFGVEVDIDEPDAADIVAPGSSEDLPVFDAEEEGSQPGPHDFLMPLATGTWGSVRWTMSGGSNPDGEQCVTFEVDAGNGAEGRYLCFPPLSAASPIQIVHGPEASANYWHVAGLVADEIVTVDVVLEGGEVITIPIDPTSHVFTLFSETPLEVDELRAITADGSSTRCSLGSSADFLTCPGGNVPPP